MKLLSQNLIHHFLLLVVAVLTVSPLYATDEVELIPFGSSWRWHHPTNGADPGPTFQSTWMNAASSGFANTGTAPLGYGVSDWGALAQDIGTPPSGSRHTAYFKKTFSVPSELNGSFYVQLLCDDGAAIYIDGKHAGRYNFSATEGYTASANSLSDERRMQMVRLSVPPDPVPDAWLGPDQLSAGTHTIAVSVHNFEPTSSDLTFDLSLFFVPHGSDLPTVVAPDGRKFIAVYLPGTTWSRDEAVDQAARWAVGGKLATVRSQAENTLVFNLIDKRRLWGVRRDAGGITIYEGPLIGGLQLTTGIEPNGGWTWGDNTPVTYTSWAPGEPNEAVAGQDLMRYWSTGSRRQTWDDEALTYRFSSFVMELPAPRSDLLHEPIWNASQNGLDYGFTEVDFPDSIFSPMGYEHCRWGVVMDRNTVGDVDLKYTRLTDATSLSPTQAEVLSELFLTDNAALFTSSPSLNRKQFPSSFGDGQFRLPIRNTNSDGFIKWNIPFYDPVSDNRILFRYLHFFPTLAEATSPTRARSNRADTPNSTTTKAIFSVHGWNASSMRNNMSRIQPNTPIDWGSGGADWWASSRFQQLKVSIQSAIRNTDWKFAEYHWEEDADTGDEPSLGHPDIDGAIASGIRAAEISRLHGRHLGALLCKECPQLTKLHLIEHSAAAWLVRDCARWLLNHHPNKDTLNIQITFLDPFIPGSATPAVSNSSLNKAKMNQLLVSDPRDITRPDALWRLENYYADDLALGTQETFTWGRAGDISDSRTDTEIDDEFFDSHSGPVWFYQESVDGESSPRRSTIKARTTIRGKGWKQSMFWSEPLIQAPSTTITKSVGEFLGALIGTVATNGLLRDSSYFNSDPLNAPALEAQWIKEGAGNVGNPVHIWSPTSGNLRFWKSTSLVATDSGRYKVRIRSRFNHAEQFTESPYFLTLVIEPAKTLADNLVGDWRFTGDLRDLSTEQNHGQDVGGVQYTEDRHGATNSALVLNGGNYVSIPHSASIGMNTDMSFSLWFKVGPTGPRGYRLLDKLTAGINDGWLFDLHRGTGNPYGITMRWIGGDGNPDYQYVYTDYNYDQWNHLGFTFGGGVAIVYLNGSEMIRKHMPTNFRTINRPLLIGASQGAGADPTEWWRGSLDDLKLWNRVLTPREMWALHVDGATDPQAGVPVNQQAYRVWAQQQGYSPEHPELDSAGNGLTNLLRYSLSSEGQDAGAASLPKVGALCGRLCLSFQRRTDDSSLTYCIQGSDDLSQWSDIAQGSGIQPILPLADDGAVSYQTTEGGKEMVYVFDNQVLGQSAKRYLRLCVLKLQ